MVTIKDVAKKAGVSPSTVSRALSGNGPVKESTRKKVLDAVKLLDYRPNFLAQGLKEGKTKTIGLIIPNMKSHLSRCSKRGRGCCQKIRLYRNLVQYR